MTIATVERTPTAADLFMFSASAWLVHRIHYDLPFTVEHEGHPGLLIHGPLQGTYLIQVAARAVPGMRIASITYRHTAPAYLGDTLVCGGSVVEGAAGDAGVVVELWARKKSDGTVTTEGRAVLEEE